MAELDSHHTPPDRFAVTLPVEGREVVNVWANRLRTTVRAKSQAKILRRKLTDAEAKLWVHLKRIRTIDTHFRKQVPIGPYVADFACLRGRIVVEVDGAQHGFDAGIQHDAKRTSFLLGRGFRVLRFWNDDVLRDIDGVLDTIYAALHGAVDAPVRSMSKRKTAQDEAPSSPSTGEVVRLAGPEGVNSPKTVCSSGAGR